MDGIFMDEMLHKRFDTINF